MNFRFIGSFYTLILTVIVSELNSCRINPNDQLNCIYKSAIIIEDINSTEDLYYEQYW